MVRGVLMLWSLSLNVWKVYSFIIAFNQICHKAAINLNFKCVCLACCPLCIQVLLKGEGRREGALRLPCTQSACIYLYSDTRLDRLRHVHSVRTLLKTTLKTVGCWQTEAITHHFITCVMKACLFWRSVRSKEQQWKMQFVNLGLLLIWFKIN